MFSGIISIRIFSEEQILLARSKARWLAEKIGFDKGFAGVLSVIISETARILLTQTQSGRIDLVSVFRNNKAGIIVRAFVSELERNEIEKKEIQKQRIIRRTNFARLTTRKLIDEYRIFPGGSKDEILQLTKWV